MNTVRHQVAILCLNLFFFLPIDNNDYEDDNRDDTYPEILQPEASMKIGPDIKQEIPDQIHEPDLDATDPNFNGNEIKLPLPYKFDVEPKKEEIILGRLHVIFFPFCSTLRQWPA